ncbi:MAG: hypothetical protein DDT19_00855 [Syntrophomonadaceae bacterium]|nr:hypothetical protein [Bacillota bacterium]
MAQFIPRRAAQITNAPAGNVTSTNVQSAINELDVKKQPTLGFTPENVANRDASGGYVGLSLLRINFRNVLNTITSFFTNSNTASRTYTFQDRDGTIADHTDIATRAGLTIDNRFTGHNTFQGRVNVATSVAGTADAITAVYIPPFTAWVDRMGGTFRATGANTTTAPTFAPDGLVAKIIVKENLAALAAGDIAGAGHEVMWIYNITADRVVLLNPRAVAGAAGASLTADNRFTGNQTFQGRVNTAISVAGTADAITAAYSPPFTAWVDRMHGRFRAIGANTTTAPTFSPDGLVAVTIVKENLVPLAAGDIAGAGHEVEWIFNAAANRVILLNPRVAGGAGGIGGSGTINRVARFTGTSTIGDSQIFDDGTHVGFGTTTPGARLTLHGVNSDAGQMIRLGWSPSFDYSIWRSVVTGHLNFDGSQTGFVAYRFNSGNVGIGVAPTHQLHLSLDSAGKPGTNTWTIVSDKRLKKSIEPANLDLCYNAVKNIPLSFYRWRDDAYSVEQVRDRGMLGWIADDVEKVYPKAVKTIPFELLTKEKIEDCKSVNNDQVYAALYGAVQKLIEKVEALERRIR